MSTTPQADRSEITQVDDPIALHESRVPYGRAIPEPTGSPMVAAAGVTLIFAGLVTNWAVTIVGVLLALGGAVAWFRQVFPEERLERIPESSRSRAETPALATAQRAVHATALTAGVHASDRAALREITSGPVRPSLPLEIHPYRVGVWGGMAGGVAMAAVACLWGVAMKGSLWLPINLLAGVFVPGIERQSTEVLESLNAGWLLTAAVIHGVGSVLVGLLYTVALPMMPKRPILFGGILAPVLWTGFIWASIGIVNPALEEYISWPWFIASQFAFGITAGIVISRFNRVPTMQFMPLRDRLHLELTHARSERGADS